MKKTKLVMIAMSLVSAVAASGCDPQAMQNEQNAGCLNLESLVQELRTLPAGRMALSQTTDLRLGHEGDASPRYKTYLVRGFFVSEKKPLEIAAGSRQPGCSEVQMESDDGWENYTVVEYSPLHLVMVPQKDSNLESITIERSGRESLKITSRTQTEFSWSDGQTHARESHEVIMTTTTVWSDPLPGELPLSVEAAQLIEVAAQHNEIE